MIFEDEPIRSLAEIEASLPEDMMGKPISAGKFNPNLIDSVLPQDIPGFAQRATDERHRATESGCNRMA